MTTTWEPMPPASSGDSAAIANTLRSAAAAYLARFKGAARTHTESDLKIFFGWCERGAAVDRAVQQPGRLAALMLTASAGQAGDQCQVVEDVAGHAAAVER